MNKQIRDLQNSAYQKGIQELQESLLFMLNDDYSLKTIRLLERRFCKHFPGESERQALFNDNLEELIDKHFKVKEKKSEVYSFINSKLMKNEELTTGPNAGDVVFMLRMAVMYKAVCRHIRLLPARRTKKFKEQYLFLDMAMDIYDSFKANHDTKEALNTYVKVHNNEGISAVVQNLQHCTEITRDRFRNFEVKYVTEKGTSIKLDVNQEEVNIFEISKQISRLIGPTQSQLIVYIMSLVFEQNKGDDVKNYCTVDIDVEEYCKLKGIEWRSDVADKILEDIKNLQRIIIKYEYTNAKGEKDILRESSLFSPRGIIDTYKKDRVTIDRSRVGVSLGYWVETLRVDQFQYINEAFFRYKLRNQKGTIIPTSYYINCLHRNNLKNINDGSLEFRVKVSNLTEKLTINESTLKAKGYKVALKEPLEKILNEIKEAEGFDWKYKNGNHESRNEFENDVIIFRNKRLDQKYIESGYVKKTKEK